MKLFKKNHTNFFEMLENHTRLLHETYQDLVQYFDHPEERKTLGERIRLREREADDIRLILIDQLHQTLITPFDREDIFSLSRDIDDVLDAAKNTVEEMQIFKVEPSPELILMAKILERGTLEIYEAMNNLKQHPRVAKDHAVNAKRTENHIHHVYLEALAKLFDDSDNNVGLVFKMREIYRHMNRSADRCDEAANRILDIIVKIE